MPIFDARELLAFPQGDAGNDTDVVFGGLHFNKTILDNWGYQYYSNGTISNGSWCIVTKPPHTPKLLYPNGTFVNSTWCYTAVNPTGLRSQIGMGFAVAYGLCIVGILMNLARHGRLHLPAEKRFFPIGRRWQWYWALIVSAAGLISLLTNVDVDRYYVIELPIVLNVFFWFLLQMAVMALIWEAIRHWGSWMERQFIDEDPFCLPQDDRRSQVEFWLPLIFYGFWWLHFFMVVPRNWGKIELQRSPEQTVENAIPAATDARFKAAAFLLFFSWVICVGSLRHSIKHYCPQNRGIVNRTFGLLRFTPFRFYLLLFLSLAMIGYQAFCAFNFDYSPLKVDTNFIAMYVGGYTPGLLILLVLIVSGFMRPNEDRELMRQRRVRGAQIDRELGLVRKPAWWKRLNPNYHPNGENMRDRIAQNVKEVGGGNPTARGIRHNTSVRAQEQEAHEMTALPRSNSYATDRSFDAARPMANPYLGKSERRRTERTMAAATSLLFPGDDAGASVDRSAELTRDGPPPPYKDRGREREMRPASAHRENSTGTTASITGPPQQVRSMLDI